MKSVVATLTLLFVATTAAAQPARQRPVPSRDRAQIEAPRGTAVVRGMIVAADSGSPIRRAQVRVSGQTAAMATTDAQGRFEVRNLPAGRYSLSAAKGGFVSLQYGQKRPSESGTPFELADGQVLDKLVIALPRGSVIGGRITDEFGEPVANASVSAMRFGYAAGARRLLPGGQNARDTTDDQGQFRLFGLPPGEYVVSASYRAGGEATDPQGENTGYAATYYPGTPSVAEAQRVTVAVSQEQNGVTFALVATRLVRVAGAVVNSQGAPVTDAGVVLVPTSGGRLTSPAPMMNFGGRVDRAGQFRIMNVPPGRYLAQVRTGRGRADAASTTEFARQDLTVGAEDLDGVVLVTAPAARILGAVASDRGAVATLRPQEVTIAARTVDPEAGLPAGNSTARVNDDWSFEIGGLFEPRVLRPNAPAGWTLKQVLLGGEDVTDTPLDLVPGQTVSGVRVVLTDRISEINGRLSDARNDAVTDATVVVFPADDEKWGYQSRFIRAARPDQEGRFLIRGLPAYDDYLAVAVQGLEDGQAGDPDFLASVRHLATRVALKEGDARTLDLRLVAR